MPDGAARLSLSGGHTLAGRARPYTSGAALIGPTECQLCPGSGVLVRVLRSRRRSPGAWWDTGRGEMVLEDLDDHTRPHMLEELRFDLLRGCLYLSPRLSGHGRQLYPSLLREAIEAGTPRSFAAALRQRGIFEHAEPRGSTWRAMPRDAADTLAEGELNRFYIRGVCRRAIVEQVAIEVYRARSVREPRPESQARIGARPKPDALLGDLRRHVGVATALGVPGGPNSGLSVRRVGGTVR